MARIPIPGGDEGNWGVILNEYLSISHTPTGYLKPGSVDETVLSPAVQTKINNGTAGPQGPQGPAGADGADGADGTNGVGVPTGGTTGQVLAKASNTTHDTQWVDQSGGGGSTSWNDLTDKPSTFSPSVHSHSIGDVTSLQAGLDSKEDSGAVASHAAGADPHATASYAIMLGGGRQIFVQSTDPGGSANDGDLWIDTSV